MKKGQNFQIQLVLLNESSMVKADQLSQQDLWLKELKENHNKDFGGLAILIFCDVQQLPLVRGKFTSEKRKSTDYHV